ncbi:MAG: ClpXP protease specificity-enhancing factor [Gammaproteobacteria bacterium]|nr:MAG: ClpXP protease specificity-enhancing factor [Gammaproteobacteria bacterium]
MTPSRPYLVRGLYEWIVDNHCTPYLLVNAEYSSVTVPVEYIKDGKIILNVMPSAVRDFHIDNDFIRFSARFSGKAQDIYIPIGAVLAIYAKENGRGMFFEADEIPPAATDDGGNEPPPTSPSGSGRPSLKVVK